MEERTPGPWELAPDRWWAVRSIQDKKTIVTAGVAGRSKEEMLANARFIAGGPDMEKALETAAYVLEHYLDYTQNDIAVMAEDARAALAKAKGEGM